MMALVVPVQFPDLHRQLLTMEPKRYEGLNEQQDRDYTYFMEDIVLDRFEDILALFVNLFLGTKGDISVVRLI